MISDLFDSDVVKILTLFSVSPGSKFSRNEIKQKTMLNNVPIDGALSRLQTGKVLLKEKMLLGLNFENENTQLIIKIIKKEHLRFKEIPLKIFYILIDLSYKLSKISSVSNAYLFGSYAKLIQTEKSDIDIAIILKKEEKRIVSLIKKEISKLEKKYDKTIEEHFFESADMKSNDPLIKEIKRNSVEIF